MLARERSCSRRRKGSATSSAPAARAGQAEFVICDQTIARGRDPPPGNTVMWRGMSRLTDIVLGSTVAAELVGN